jgi:hypothetical protein
LTELSDIPAYTLYSKKPGSFWNLIIASGLIEYALIIRQKILMLGSVFCISPARGDIIDTIIISPLAGLKILVKNRERLHELYC